MSVVIRPETSHDQEAIWSVNQAAFEGAELESSPCYAAQLDKTSMYIEG
jgi:predicted N-acetyltransferase YhbS